MSGLSCKCFYWDSYQRVDGTWLFKKRLPMYWYATDLNKPPLGNKKMRWPDEDNYEGFFHDLFLGKSFGAVIIFETMMSQSRLKQISF